MVELSPSLVSEPAREGLQVVGVVAQVIQGLLALQGVSASLL